MSSIEAFVRTERVTTRRRNRWLGPAISVATIGLAVAVTYQPPSSERAFDPASTGPTGLAGLVDVLEQLDVNVTVTSDLAVAGAADAVLVPPLGWSDDEVLALAEEGARVVAVVRPDREAVSNPVSLGGLGLVTKTVDCPLLGDVETLRSVEWPGWQPDVGHAAAPADRCITDGSTSWLTRVDIGSGELISLGGMGPFVNARLFDSDASIAVVRLLVPTGTERVVILGAPTGPAPMTLFDVIDPRWFDAAWLSLAMLFVVAATRGRRLGRPMSEELPVRVPSGELARAIGDLRHRAGHEAASGAALRSRTTEQLRRRLGLSTGATPDDVVAALSAANVPLHPDEHAALVRGLPTDPDALVAHARTLAALRGRLATGTPIAPSTPDPTRHEDHP